MNLLAFTYYDKIYCINPTENWQREKAHETHYTPPPITNFWRTIFEIRVRHTSYAPKDELINIVHNYFAETQDQNEIPLSGLISYSSPQ